MIEPNIKEIWEAHKAEFLKLLAAEQSEKITHAALEKWFIDSEGNQYYRFPKTMALPLERLGHLKGYYTWLASGVSGAEMEQIIHSMETVLSEGIGRVETAAKLGTLVHLLKERQQMVVHTEIIYNILAVQAIREDERPDVFNNQIQLEKVAQFKKEVAMNNAYFFFHQTQLKTPIDLLTLSREEFITLWAESEIHQTTLKQILDLILREKPSTKQDKTLISN